jgi:putative Ca2+/H+ antiporter (TMEM165/GDT1 family)
MFDWKLFATTFLTVFLAELGDKTQFAALGLAAGAPRLREVWVAVVLALSVAGTLGVVAGKWLAAWVNPGVLRWVSGFAFIAMGLWVLYGAWKGDSSPAG